MPYVAQDLKYRIDHPVSTLVQSVQAESMGVRRGLLNYCITRLINESFRYDSYSDFNDAIGVLECVKLEFYMRRVHEYEKKKLAENGDVY